MQNAECRICGTVFQAQTSRRQLCDKCQKNSGKAQAAIDKAAKNNKFVMDGYRYHECVCKQCGKQFFRYGKKADFCSSECRALYVSVGFETPTAKHCAMCGKEITDAKSDSLFCSALCENEYRQTNSGILPDVIKCKACGKSLPDKRYYDDVCDKTCFDAYKWIEARQNGTATKCVACGKEFIKKYDLHDTCSAKCSDEYRRNTTVLVEATCEICGTTFQKHANAVRYTCSKECSEIRKQKTADKKKEEQRQVAKADAGTKRAKEIGTDRGDLVQKALSGEITGKDVAVLHLCSGCKTSQADCIRFTSNFVYHPKGAVIKVVNKQNVVLVCPQYNS